MPSSPRPAPHRPRPPHAVHRAGSKQRTWRPARTGPNSPGLYVKQLACRVIAGSSLGCEIHFVRLAAIGGAKAGLPGIPGLPSIPGVFSPFLVVRDYAKIAREHNITFPEKFDWLISQMNDAEAAMMNTSRIQRPCHNDLLNGNFLLANQLYILDWEYAGMGDVFFDLANFSNNHELSEDEDHFLLDCYFGRVSSQAIAHMNIMKIMSDFREAMWGLVQVRISDLDFDFLGYANQHFLRLLQRALNPNWEAWLKEFR